MGCGQSKGVSPETEEAQEANKTFIGSEVKAKQAWQTASESAQGTAAVSEHPHAAKAQFVSQDSTNVGLNPGAQHSLTAPAVLQPRQLAPPDPEFDYTHELRAVPTAATVPKAPVTGLAGAEALSSARPAALAPLSTPSTAVGGLLSRQPDWLRDSDAPAPPVVSYSNSVSGATAAETLNSSSSNNNNSRAVAGTSSLPPIGKGIVSSAAIAAGASSLPPISSAGLLQQSVTAASGTPAATAAFPEPRRLTRNVSNHSKGEVPSDAAVTGISSRKGDPACSSGSGAVRDSFNGDTSAAAGKGHWGDALEESRDSADSQRMAAGQGAVGLPVHDEVARSASRDFHSTEASVEGAAAAESCDPSDPWRALQSQYVAGAGPPSPDVSAAGGAGNLPHGGGSLIEAAAGIQGSRRATSNQVRTITQPQAARKSTELVLMDSDNEEAELTTGSGQVNNRHFADVLQGEQSQQQVTAGLGPEVSGSLAAESSRARIAAGKRAAAGGWGGGNMAAAGTLMLGDGEESEGPREKGHQQSLAAARTVHDDVFGDDSPRSSAYSIPGQDSRSRLVGSCSRRAGELSNQLSGPAGHAAAVEDELGVEEIDDVDALIEAELAAKNALPGDLAAKLAQFEALTAGDED